MGKKKFYTNSIQESNQSVQQAVSKKIINTETDNLSRDGKKRLETSSEKYRDQCINVPTCSLGAEQKSPRVVPTQNIQPQRSSHHFPTQQSQMQFSYHLPQQIGQQYPIRPYLYQQPQQFRHQIHTPLGQPFFLYQPVVYPTQQHLFLSRQPQQFQQFHFQRQPFPQQQTPQSQLQTFIPFEPPNEM